MKKICFAGYHKHVFEVFGKNDGGTSYGYRVWSFAVELARRMFERGYVLTNFIDDSICEANIAVFFDVDDEMLKLRDSLPTDMACILMAIESPLYCPLNHDPSVIYDSRWTAVLTLDKTFSGENIFYTTIPANNQSFLSALPQKKFVEGRKGIVIKSNTIDIRQGKRCDELAFVRQLAQNNIVDIYGRHWAVSPEKNLRGPTENKLKTLIQYDYTFISENVLLSGFFTEKVGDAVLAGVPSIYYGDWETAEERFPGCFVPLKALNIPDFLEARQKLYESYSQLLLNIQAAFDKRDQWNEPFFSLFEKAVSMCEKNASVR
jgi:hypothetical protein